MVRLVLCRTPAQLQQLHVPRKLDAGCLSDSPEARKDTLDAVDRMRGWAVEELPARASLEETARQKEARAATMLNKRQTFLTIPVLPKHWFLIVAAAAAGRCLLMLRRRKRIPHNKRASKARKSGHRGNRTANMKQGVPGYDDTSSYCSGIHMFSKFLAKLKLR